MLKYISFLIFKLFLIFDKILLLIFKKSFLLHFKNFIEKNLYKEIKILNNNIKFLFPVRLYPGGLIHFTQRNLKL